jgi:ABC-type taurine transport system ATPase subunit
MGSGHACDHSGEGCTVEVADERTLSGLEDEDVGARCRLGVVDHLEPIGHQRVAAQPAGGGHIGGIAGQFLGLGQRVGIARALLMNPRVILMDEPFAALDAQTKLEMQEELVAIWQKHRCTIVFVTHSVDEALVLGNKIVVMTRRPGRIRESVTFDLPRPRDITSPEFNDAKRRVLALIREESMRVAQVA